MNCIFYRPLEEVIRIHEEKQVQFSQSLHFKQKACEHSNKTDLVGQPTRRSSWTDLMPRCWGFSRNLFPPKWNLVHAFFKGRFLEKKSQEP